MEGYIESAACGLLAGRFAAAERRGAHAAPPPATTALGALLSHITGGHIVADGDELADVGDQPIEAKVQKPRSFQPMNINFGLILPIAAPRVASDGRRLKGKERTVEKKRMMSRRALADLQAWLAKIEQPRAA